MTFSFVLFEVTPPAVYLRVTENVPQIVSFIERIVEHGHAYPTQEGEDFGALSAIIMVSVERVIDGHSVHLQATCILTSSPSVNATAGSEELLILNQNPVSTK